MRQSLSCICANDLTFQPKSQKNEALRQMFGHDQPSPNSVKYNAMCPDKVCKRSNTSTNKWRKIKFCAKAWCTLVIIPVRVREVGDYPASYALAFSVFTLVMKVGDLHIARQPRSEKRGNSERS